MTHVDLIEKLLRFVQPPFKLWKGQTGIDVAVVTTLPTETATGDHAPDRFAVRCFTIDEMSERS